MSYKLNIFYKHDVLKANSSLSHTLTSDSSEVCKG